MAMHFRQKVMTVAHLDTHLQRQEPKLLMDITIVTTVDDRGPRAFIRPIRRSLVAGRFQEYAAAACLRLSESRSGKSMKVTRMKHLRHLPLFVSATTVAINRGMGRRPEVSLEMPAVQKEPVVI